MANSFFEVTAAGGNTFNIPFDYIQQSEIAVYVEGVSTPFTFTSSNVIDITPAPTNGALVRIERTTNLSERAVDFASGAVLTEEDLDTSNIQVFHAAQEALDKVEQTMRVDVDGKWDSQSRVIKNVASPIADTDAVNRAFLTTNLPAINRVQQSIANVDTVAADLNEPVSEISTVAGSIANVNTVGLAIANVTTTADKITNVNRVALSANNLDTVAASITNVDTTSANITRVNNVGNNITDVVTVADNIDDVKTVASDIAKVITAADDLNEAVSEINTVAGNITNVNTVGLNITNVNTVASISTDVTRLVDRYFVQATQPTSGMATGDLWYSTSQNQLYTYTGLVWELTSAYSEAMVRQNDYVAVAGQTVFSGTDKNGFGMLVVNGATIFVYKNGILIEEANDYSIDYATSQLTLLDPAAADEEVRVIQINPFDSLEYNELVAFKDTALSARDAAISARDVAESYKTAANNSANAAALSETNAGVSESNAATSETNAAASELQAASSAANAVQSAANAFIFSNVAADPWTVQSGTGNLSYAVGDVSIKKSLDVRGNSSTGTSTLLTPGTLAVSKSDENPDITFHHSDGSRMGYIGFEGTVGDESLVIKSETGGVVDITGMKIRNSGVDTFLASISNNTDVATIDIDFSALGIDTTVYKELIIRCYNMGVTAAVSARGNFYFGAVGTAGTRYTGATHRAIGVRALYDGTTSTTTNETTWNTGYVNLGTTNDSTSHWSYLEWTIMNPARNAYSQYASTAYQGWKMESTGVDTTSRPRVVYSAGYVNNAGSAGVANSCTGVRLYLSAAGNFRNTDIKIFGRVI